MRRNRFKRWFSCQADFEIINMGNANLRAALPDLTYKTYRRILKLITAYNF
jgi:hypothetical protein